LERLFSTSGRGFDFIISKHVDQKIVIRPVQVNGKYPTSGKWDKASYGYVGKLTALHSEMVLAIPYFLSDDLVKSPVCAAYMPHGLIRRLKKGYRGQPATFKVGRPQPKRHYRQFFDADGIRLLELDDWSRKIAVT
jgi:hypothetical protein